MMRKSLAVSFLVACAAVVVVGIVTAADDVLTRAFREREKHCHPVDCPYAKAYADIRLANTLPEMKNAPPIGALTAVAISRTVDTKEVTIDLWFIDGQRVTLWTASPLKEHEPMPLRSISVSRFPRDER